MEIFKVQDLSFTYPTSHPASNQGKALNGINLSIQEGEWVLLCGKSGSGKSTLLRHFKPEVTPHGKRKGIIQYGGVDVREVDRGIQAAEIGYLLQNPDNQIVTDKVWHELAFGLENLGMDRETIRVRVAEMSTYFGIGHWFDKHTSELSGGQKQILNLAAVMVLKPKVLVLDEPTAQLDPMAAMEFHGVLERINQDLGVTIIMAEQRLEGVASNADRLVVLDEGRILLDGRPAKVGERLKEWGHGMFLAMPSPMQIYAGVESGTECPLTVKEARDWLKKEIGDNKRIAVALDGNQENKRVNGMGRIRFNRDDGEKAIELKDVWFRYEKKGEDVLRGLNFHAKKGAVTAVIGGNGTGKTTMLSILCGIQKPYSGKRILNADTVISCLPQSPTSLFTHNTISRELEEMTGDVGRLEEVLSWMGLSDIRYRHPFDVSGGEQQRTALAKVLLTEPDVLLLDEPTKGMDAEFKEEMGLLLTRLREKKKTVILVSHDVEFCARHSDDTALLFQGQISVMGGTREVFSGNSFYTTAANKIAGDIDRYAITIEDVVNIWKKGKGRP